MTVSGEKDAVSRLTDSAETAMYEGDGACLLRFYQPDGTYQPVPFQYQVRGGRHHV